jgi:hypothetical protein
VTGVALTATKEETNEEEAERDEIMSSSELQREYQRLQKHNLFLLKESKHVV